ncbi:MAG: FAD-dependent oxidoreductase, partial [Lentisphaeria bacterium]|nr:FAD-dependent oxidoreductase [Lentisphaeria bacterium]
MIYDTAIIGAGACGAATAWHLSHTDCKTILLEKEADAGFGVSKANSGIVHGGFHHASDSLKTKLELRGNKLFDVLHKELGFPYHKCGILVAAYSEEQMETVKKLYQRGLDNGVTNMELCDRARMLELEPKLNSAICGGFFAPDGGTIEPYGYVF